MCTVKKCRFVVPSLLECRVMNVDRRDRQRKYARCRALDKGELYFLSVRAATCPGGESLMRYPVDRQSE